MRLRLRTTLVFASSATLFCAFAFFVSAAGQRWLWTHADRNNPAYKGWPEHSIDNDIAMGMSLMPWFYILPAAVLLAAIGLILRTIDCARDSQSDSQTVGRR